jgi:hypothetical protein
MAGSHDVRRKQRYRNENKYKLSELIESGTFKVGEQPIVGEVKLHNGRYWCVENIVIEETKKPVGFWAWLRSLVGFPVQPDPNDVRLFVYEVRKIVDGDGKVWYDPIFNLSEFWLPLSGDYRVNVEKLMEYILSMKWPEEKYSIMLYGELFGAGVQDMQYGMTGIEFRAFDISINNKYLDFDLKKQLFDTCGINMVPVLYRGPFSVQTLEEFTSGPTTMCDPDKAGNFKGREGIVATPVIEVHYCPVLNGRRIVKSVSADYHARKGGTEFH